MYDLIIIGAGPAGLTASIYASCFHLKHLILGTNIGGQMMLAPDILNYSGFESVSGKELTAHMLKQVISRGGEVVTQSVSKITNSEAGPAARVSQTTLQQHAAEVTFGNPSLASPAFFIVETQEGKKYQTKAIILATGTERRKLNIPGEVEYTAKGVHYCATCEEFDYDGKICAVIGGANSAVQAAVELAQGALKVYIIYRGKELRGDPIWLEQVGNNPKIEVIYNTAVTEIVGDNNKVTGVTLSSKLKTQSEKLTLDKVFIEIGGVPGTALVIPIGVQMDRGGYIKVDERLATNVAGVYAAGDLVSYGLSIEQISSAVGLGARAAASAFAYLKKDKAPVLWGNSNIRR